jgi:hypothetical protein
MFFELLGVGPFSSVKNYLMKKGGRKNADYGFPRKTD